MQSTYLSDERSKQFILGIDLGRVRCGLAVAQTGMAIALPLAVVATEPRDALARRIADALEHRNLELIVAGLPLDQRGREGEAAAWARESAQQLADELAVQVEFIDERFSTREAYASRKQAGLKARRNRETIDSAAATVILQAYLDRFRLSDQNFTK